MSLDVYLTGEIRKAHCRCACGHEHEIEQVEEFYNANITHNLNRMATEAGIYEVLWRPEKVGITKAQQLIEPLEKGLALMRSDRVRFEKFNATNGWGTYEQFIPWLINYLDACRRHPEASVRVSR